MSLFELFLDITVLTFDQIGVFSYIICQNLLWIICTNIINSNTVLIWTSGDYCIYKLESLSYIKLLRALVISTFLWQIHQELPGERNFHGNNSTVIPRVAMVVRLFNNPGWVTEIRNFHECSIFVEITVSYSSEYTVFEYFVGLILSLRFAVRSIGKTPATFSHPKKIKHVLDTNYLIKFLMDYKLCTNFLRSKNWIENNACTCCQACWMLPLIDACVARRSETCAILKHVSDWHGVPFWKMCISETCYR